MLLFFRKTDIQNNKVSVLRSTASLFISGRQVPPPNAQLYIERNILPLKGGLVADYDWLDIPDSDAPAKLGFAREVILNCDAQGKATAIDEWHLETEITGLMQLTVSKGPYRGYSLDLPLADRQINVTADPTYSTIIEVSIIRNDTTGALDVAYCTNGAAIAAGWSKVQTLLKGVIPAGTTDITNLGLL